MKRNEKLYPKKMSCGGDKVMEKGYKISVIVPIYNVEPYLVKCIESILGQTYTNLQVILVDDGATDDSGKICDDFARKDNRIQVIHKMNGGLVSARKAGLKIADGDFIGFVDSDDYVEPSYYEILLKDIVNSQADLVHTGYIYDQYGYSTKILQFENAVCDLNSDVAAQMIKQYILGQEKSINITASIWSKLFKSDLIKKCYEKVPDGQSFGEDLICLCACLLEGKKICLHREAFYHYNMRPGSITNKKEVISLLDAAALYHCLKKLFSSYDILDQVNLSLDHYYVGLTVSMIKKIDSFSGYIYNYVFRDIDLIRGKKIVIYGAGNVGQGYYAQICRYTSCKIVGWIDNGYKDICFDYANIVAPKSIRNMQYDFVLIAVEKECVAEEIKQELSLMGVSENKLIWEKPITLG